MEKQTSKREMEAATKPQRLRNKGGGWGDPCKEKRDTEVGGSKNRNCI